MSKFLFALFIVCSKGLFAALPIKEPAFPETDGGGCMDREERISCLRAGGTLSLGDCSCAFPVKPVTQDKKPATARAAPPARASAPQPDSAFEQLKSLAAQCRAAGQQLTQQCKSVSGADSQGSGAGIQDVCSGLAKANNQTAGRIEEMLQTCRQLSGARSEACNRASALVPQVRAENRSAAQSLYASALAAGQPGQQTMGALQTYNKALNENSTKNAEECKKEVSSDDKEKEEPNANAGDGAGPGSGANGVPESPNPPPTSQDNPNGRAIAGLTEDDLPKSFEPASGLSNSFNGGGSDDVGDGSQRSGGGVAGGGAYGQGGPAGEGDVSNRIAGNGNAPRGGSARSALVADSLASGGLGDMLADDPAFKESLKKGMGIRGRGLASWASDSEGEGNLAAQSAESEEGLDPKDPRWASFAPDLQKWFAKDKKKVQCTPLNRRSEPICVHPAEYTHVASANIFRKNGDALRGFMGVSTIAQGLPGEGSRVSKAAKAAKVIESSGQHSQATLVGEKHRKTISRPAG